MVFVSLFLNYFTLSEVGFYLKKKSFNLGLYKTAKDCWLFKIPII